MSGAEPRQCRGRRHAPGARPGTGRCAGLRGTRIAPNSLGDLDHNAIRGAVPKVEATGRLGFANRDDDLAVLANLSVYQAGR